MNSNLFRLTEPEVKHLEMLVNADLKSRVDDQRHAAAYGGAHVDTTIPTCETILEVLRDPIET